MNYYLNIFSSFAHDFNTVFVAKDRYQQFLKGIVNTLEITAGALIIGLIIGVVVAAIRSSYDKNKESLKAKGGFGYVLLSILNGLCKVYLTVIRGTPVVVQL
ncbi:MAG: amino acid ABC transporter permease, partial [Clostridia bacterium]|nr:amino acid ABC transporter permease [Clostridia bacterium]